NAVQNKHTPVHPQPPSFTKSPRRLTNTNKLPDKGSSSKTLFTSPTNPSIDLRKSTGLLYAKIRRTSGVNHIALASHPQAHAGGVCHFHRPRPAHAARRRVCDKLPLRPRFAPPPPLPFLTPP